MSELIASDKVPLHHPVPVLGHDRDGFARMVTDFHAGFSGFDIIAEHMLVRDGVAVIRWKLRIATRAPGWTCRRAAMTYQPSARSTASATRSRTQSASWSTGSTSIHLACCARLEDCARLPLRSTADRPPFGPSRSRG